MKKDRTQIFALLFCCLAIANCTVSSELVVGTWVNPASGDTLYMQADKSYAYMEKLYSGAEGWTEGKWTLQKKTIQFRCNSKPWVNYRRTILPDSTVNSFQIELLLAATNSPIHIEEVKLFSATRPLNAESSKKENNIVRIFSKDVDSIAISTSNFRVISFTNELSPDRGYKVRIYPLERLYELDKVPFRFKKSALTSTRTKQYDNIHLSFEKLKS